MNWCRASEAEVVRLGCFCLHLFRDANILGQERRVNVEATVLGRVEDAFWYKETK